jgi:hypothetical protein
VNQRRDPHPDLSAHPRPNGRKSNLAGDRIAGSVTTGKDTQLFAIYTRFPRRNARFNKRALLFLISHNIRALCSVHQRVAAAIEILLC